MSTQGPVWSLQTKLSKCCTLWTSTFPFFPRIRNQLGTLSPPEGIGVDIDVGSQWDLGYGQRALYSCGSVQHPCIQGDHHTGDKTIEPCYQGKSVFVETDKVLPWAISGGPW